MRSPLVLSFFSSSSQSFPSSLSGCPTWKLRLPSLFRTRIIPSFSHSFSPAISVPKVDCGWTAFPACLFGCPPNLTRHLWFSLRLPFPFPPPIFLPNSPPPGRKDICECLSPRLLSHSSFQGPGFSASPPQDLRIGLRSFSHVCCPL